MIKETCSMENKKQDTNHKCLLKLLGSKGKDAANPEQINEFKRIFKRLDANGDGKVTLQEYINRSRWEDETKAKAIFNATDRNGNGTIDTFGSNKSPVTSIEYNWSFSAPAMSRIMGNPALG